MKTIEEVIRLLPSDLQEEVEDFARFLLEKDQKSTKNSNKDTLEQDWAGGLRDYRDQYTALELQKKALEWRGD